MMKRTLMVTMVLLLFMGALAGCYKMGKATGKAADQVEESAGDFEKGYEKGKSE